MSLDGFACSDFGLACVRYLASQEGLGVLSCACIYGGCMWHVQLNELAEYHDSWNALSTVILQR